MRAFLLPSDDRWSGRSADALRWIAGCLLCSFCLSSASANPHVQMATNHWQLAPGDVLDRIAFVFAPVITVDGIAHDDTFWLGTEKVDLNGRFENDAWVVAPIARLNGFFADHARVVARSISVDATVSNGLWAAGLSVATTTNSVLIGDQFILGSTLSLLGLIEGNLYARARQITIGGAITGNVYLHGDDIVIRPGTTVLGDLYYITTNQAIVLAANSHVGGEMKRIEKPDTLDWSWSPAATALMQLFWFAGALLAAIPFMLLFPAYTGQSVQRMRVDLWKCGLAGMALLFGLPFLVLAAMFTVIGLPVALLASAGYGILLYLGKIPVALAIGTALLQRRGQISLPVALLALVIGLFLYYSMSLVPFVGSSLQTAATAFGAGSLVLTLAAGRGKVRVDTISENIQSER